ncbi:MAG: hypothetical protein KAS32_07935 [Candidatus Peribacteraceae bacterium]|nr:hypothetical protein [Candidatus Peribacteraceae bacterium]
MEKTFAPAKIILSGEYAVVRGYPGIAIPYSRGITVTYEENLGRPDLCINWPNVDIKWIEYTQRIIDICKKENEHIFGKLTISSLSPLGKGMGSSTALIISICKCLLGDDCMNTAKNIEDELSPGNSGIDFEVIWNNRPVLFQKGKEILFINLPNLDDVILIDTGMPSETTAQLVAWMETQDKEDALKEIGKCTERISKYEDINTVIKDHHKAQVKLEVVPKKVQEFISEIEELGGAAKVIGAGGKTKGGGIVLVKKIKEDSIPISNYSYSII